MTKEKLKDLSEKIANISDNFEQKPWTENVKLLKEDFNVGSINTPKYYRGIIDELEEVLRESRLLFLYSIFNVVCKEEDKVYIFGSPYQASMIYDGVLKKEDSFYLRDEDGDYREISTSEKFVQFVDDLYWEIYE